ncbi:hypothetical protein ACRCPS_17970 [Pseudomonas aeruginosa]
MNIQASLTRRIVPAGASEERLWDFHHPNGRSFEIRQFGQKKFLLGEFEPNGRVSESTPKGLNFYTCPVVRLGLKVCKPNELSQWLSDQEIDRDSLVRVGAGIGLDSLYWPSLEAACEQIQEALEQNTWYRKVAKVERPERDQTKALVDPITFWQLSLNKLLQAESEQGIFKGCHGMSGALVKEHKDLILSYLNKPNQERWGSIRSILITANTTLWSAWANVDKGAPRSGTKGYPPKEMLEKAIRSAVESWKKHVQEQLARATMAKNIMEVSYAMP